MMFYERIVGALLKNRDKTVYTSDGVNISGSGMYALVCAVYEAVRDNAQRRPVMIYGNKEPYMKAAVIACLLLGIPYSPVDSSYPDERVNAIAALLEPYCIIGDFKGGAVPCISPGMLCPTEPAETLPTAERDVNDTCYIIFTSGSTGTPKGVEVSYGNLESCVNWLLTLSGNCSCVLGTAKFSFDLSVADFYISAVLGARHVSLSEREIGNYQTLFSALADSAAELAVMTPTFAQLLLADKSFCAALMPGLKRIIFCGEALRAVTVKKLRERFPGIVIINCYGPTETTFAVTSAEVNGESEPVPLGAAKPGTELHIDKNGELIIAGDTVAKGYLPPADSSAFFELNGKRAYRTGDFCTLDNGVLYFSGRRDRQVKYAGYRIELDEIENALLKLGCVESAAVAARKDKNGSVRAILAFVTVNADVCAQEISERLCVILPQYMIPKIKIIEKMPLTANGKCDLKSLIGE